MLRSLVLIASLCAYGSVVKVPPGCATRPCTYTLDTAGSTATNAENDELQAALNDAERGDTILLTAGKAWTGVSGTLTGAFSIYDVAGSAGYLTIKSTEYAKFPASGTRITPSHAVNMARLSLTAAADHAILLFPIGASAAQYIRFQGIEFYNASLGYSDDSGLDLIRIGSPGTAASASQLPNFIEFLQCYLHANTTSAAENRNAIIANARNVLIQDSWISEIKMANGVETHAVAWYSTPGPTTVTNTWIEAAAIPLLIGGGPQDVNDVTMMPANITITRNTIHKPLKWYSLDPNYVGIPYVNKNMLEFKIGQTGTVQYNALYNNFKGPNNDQSGSAIAVNIRLPNDAASAAFAKTDNVTVSNNVVQGSFGGISVLGSDPNYSFTGVVEDLTVANNLFYDIGCTWDFQLCTGGYGPRYFANIGGGTRHTYTNNSMFGQSGATTTEAQWYWLFNESDPAYPVTSGFIFTNNIGPLAPFKWRLSGGGYNEAAVNSKTSTAGGPVTVQGNVAPGQSSTDWDGCTGGRTCGSMVYPSEADFNSNAAQLWRDPANGDFTYQTASTYRSAGASGAQIGVDASTIPRVYDASVQVGTTKAVINWKVSQALVGTACNVEISTSAYLINALGAYSVVADVNPSNTGYDLSTRTGSIVDANTTAFVAGYNSALSPSTLYYYRVTCGPSFITGSFTTRASGNGSAVFRYSTARTGQYSSSPTMSSPTPVSSSTTHTIPIGSGAVVYYQQTSGPILPVV